MNRHRIIISAALLVIGFFIGTSIIPSSARGVAGGGCWECGGWNATRCVKTKYGSRSCISYCDNWGCVCKASGSICDEVPRV